MSSKKTNKPPKTLRIISDDFVIRYEENGTGGGLRCCMRLDYNESNGIQIFISKEKGIWLVHSHPYPGPLPKKELGEFIRLFKRSVQKFNPKARFKRTLVAT